MDDNSAKFVGSIPDFYERGMGPVIFVDFSADMAQRVKALDPKLVVETAAGTGILTRAMRDVLPGRTKIIATDLNPPMLEVAKRKFARGEPVVLQPADAVNLPFDDECCDLLVCQFGLMFFPDKEQSFRTAYRVLEDGGHYLVSVWDSHAFNPFGALIHRVACSFFPNDPPQFYAVPFSYGAIDPIKAGLMAAGFSSVDVSVKRIEKEVADPELFARGTVFGNPMYDQIVARGGDPEAVAAAMLAELKAEFGTDPMVLQLQEVVFQARKGAVPRH
jgi:ubiquinone/menaquinone biosynthesis C-methylase UbiE